MATTSNHSNHSKRVVVLTNVWVIATAPASDMGQRADMYARATSSLSVGELRQLVAVMAEGVTRGQEAATAMSEALS